MPIYEYTCPSCKLQFEELLKLSERGKSIPCKSCGSVAEPSVISTFGVISKASNGSIAYSNNEIDRVVGQKSEDKWNGYNDKWKDRYSKKQTERRDGKEITEVTMERESDGKFAPLLNLGNKAEKSKRRDYSQALQKHREIRKSKGLGQFDGSGPLKID